VFEVSLFLKLEWSYLRDIDLRWINPWIPNMNKIHPIVQAAARRTSIHIHWQIQSIYFLMHAFRPLYGEPEYYSTYAFLFQDCIPINYWNSIKNSEPFSRKSKFCVWRILSRAPIFGVRMSTLSGPRHTVEKIKYQTWTKSVQPFRH
jgi:hypothetical protein